MPHNRFFAVRLTVTNSGVVTSGIPPIFVADQRGTSYPELTDAEGVSEWLGYIRTVKPADTLHGPRRIRCAHGGIRVETGAMMPSRRM